MTEILAGYQGSKGVSDGKQSGMVWNNSCNCCSVPDIVKDKAIEEIRDVRDADNEEQDQVKTILASERQELYGYLRTYGLLAKNGSFYSLRPGIARSDLAREPSTGCRTTWAALIPRPIWKHITRDYIEEEQALWIINLFDWVL